MFILKNPLYTGRLLQGRYEKLNYTYSGEGKKIVKKDEEKWIEGETFDAIIDKGIFETVNNMLEENISTKQGSQQKKIFIGVLKCGDCGKALVYKDKSKGYKCSGSQKKEYGCTTHFVKEDELFEVISNKIEELINGKNVIIVGAVNRKIDQVNSVKYYSNQIIKINEKKVKAITTLTEVHINKHETKHADEVIEALGNKIDKLEEEKKGAEKGLEEGGEYKKQMEEILYNINEYIKKENWRIKPFIKRIVLYQDNKIEIEWRC